MSLDHENIVKMYGYDIQGQIVTQVGSLKGVWFIALEYISQQTLIDLVKEFGRLDERIAKHYIYSLAQTLVYITSKGFSHRDIKLENMLVNEEYQLKLTDFGFASFSKELLTHCRGTPMYIAPEIIQ